MHFNLRNWLPFIRLSNEQSEEGLDETRAANTAPDGSATSEDEPAPTESEDQSDEQGSGLTPAERRIELSSWEEVLSILELPEEFDVPVLVDRLMRANQRTTLPKYLGIVAPVKRRRKWSLIGVAEELSALRRDASPGLVGIDYNWISLTELADAYEFVLAVAPDEAEERLQALLPYLPAVFGTPHARGIGSARLFSVPIPEEANPSGECRQVRDDLHINKGEPLHEVACGEFDFVAFSAPEEWTGTVREILEDFAPVVDALVWDRPEIHVAGFVFEDSPATTPDCSTVAVDDTPSQSDSPPTPGGNKRGSVDTRDSAPFGTPKSDGHARSNSDDEPAATTSAQPTDVDEDDAETGSIDPVPPKPDSASGDTDSESDSTTAESGEPPPMDGGQDSVPPESSGENSSDSAPDPTGSDPTWSPDSKSTDSGSEDRGDKDSSSDDIPSASGGDTSPDIDRDDDMLPDLDPDANTSPDSGTKAETTPEGRDRTDISPDSGTDSDSPSEPDPTADSPPDSTPAGEESDTSPHSSNTNGGTMPSADSVLPSSPGRIPDLPGVPATGSGANRDEDKSDDGTTDPESWEDASKVPAGEVPPARNPGVVDVETHVLNEVALHAASMVDSDATSETEVYGTFYENQEGLIRHYHPVDSEEFVRKRRSSVKFTSPFYSHLKHLAEIHKDINHRLCGDGHSHPGGIPEQSPADRRFSERIWRNEHNHVFIIAIDEGDGPEEWQVVNDGYEVRRRLNSHLIRIRVYAGGSNERKRIRIHTEMGI